MDALRQQIDEIDGKVQKLLKERYTISRKIGEEKKRHGLPVFVPKREAAIMEKICFEDKALEWAVRRTYEEIFRISKHLQQKDNLIFISGMPGSGKTTLGRAFAERYHLPFRDLDALIEARFGPISEIFSREGEVGFRKKETEMLFTLKGERGVCALGGGTLLSEENRKFLERYWLVYLDRPLEEILKDIHWESRPLLKEKRGALEKLWRERCGIYEEFYDFKIENQGTLEETLRKMEENLSFMISENKE